MINEIMLAQKLYHARDTMRRFLGERYFEKVNSCQDDIRKAMLKFGLSELNATMKLVELLQQRVPDSGMTQAIYLAACVEMLEPG